MVEIKKILDKDGWLTDLNPSQSTSLELLLSEGYIRYVQDMTGMRVDAKALGLEAKDWRQALSVQEILQNLTAHEKDLAAYLPSLAPQGGTYEALQNELVRLVEDGKREQRMVLLDSPGLLKPGEGDAHVPLLRARFDLSEKQGTERYTYDPELVAALKNFQEEQGLQADGIIGQKTLRMLNQTQTDKIQQIIVNLERLRWLPEQRYSRYIVVNLPSATLWAIDNGEVSYEMPVVVGTKERPTASFITFVHGVRFNPTWTIPPTVKVKDIWPKLKDDPNYIQDKGIEVYDGYGKEAKTLDPSVIDWKTISKAELSALRMVQIPGAHNPLGRIRVLMPNHYNIFLHDTNHPELFSAFERTQSSGCIRMQKPEDIARFIMKKYPHWSEERMQEILDSGKEKDYYIQEKMPVYLLYQTVWLGDKNRIIYGEDIYGHDAKLWKELEKIDQIRL